MFLDRDLKSHNVLLDKNFTVAKVADFGLSHVRDSVRAKKSQSGKGMFGVLGTAEVLLLSVGGLTVNLVDGAGSNGRSGLQRKR